MHYPIKTTAIGILLLFEALGCSALTLGHAGGAVILGKPLDVSTIVQVDEGDDIASLCLMAEISYGDVQQSPSYVKLILVPGVNGQPARVNIRASNPVDEPVVAVTVQAGCTQKISRRYVFLAEVYGETLSAPITAVAPVVNVSSAVAPNRVLTTTQVNPQISSTRKPHVRKSISVVQPKIDVVQLKSKLKLSSIDAREQWAPGLKITDELFTQPVENIQIRSAALALWLALNAQPDAIARERRQLGDLDVNVKALRAVTEKNELNLGDLRARLQEAEAKRFSNGWVYGLAALLLCCLLGILYLWRRQRGESRLVPNWWQSEQESQQVNVNSQELTGIDQSAPGALPVRTAFVDIDLDLRVQEPPSATDSQPPPVAAFVKSVPAVSSDAEWSSDRRFSPSTVSALRATNTEELVDVRQQADFFISLGRYDQAIHTLQERIGAHIDASPLIYLDLMQIYRKLDRRVDFNKCRDNFNRLFSAVAPEFVSFDAKGEGLEAYPPLLDKIVSAWPSGQATEMLEGFIFRNPEHLLTTGIDLQAFEELLLLHGVATRLLGSVSSR